MESRHRLALVLLAAGLAGGAEPPALERWVWCMTNLQVDANAESVCALIRRSAKAGGTALCLTDSKFARLAERPANYFANVKKVQAAASACGLAIVPALFGLGYSEGLLAHDPDLAEALPVRDAPFIVKEGMARPLADAEPLLPGGTPLDPRRWDWKDEAVHADPAGGVRMDAKGGNLRLVKKLKLRPWTQYHVSVWIRTQDFHGTPEIKALADGHELQYAHLGVKPTQDWTWHHAVFNTLEHDAVTLYLGAWGATSGSVWWKDAVAADAGLVNLVRRDGAPFAVRTQEGKALTEGGDFQAVADPHLGRVPWLGAYDVWHEPPAIRTSLPEGTRLLVDFHHAITVYDHQVMICPSEAKTVVLLADEARRVHALWQARTYLMSHDEIRVLNQDASCRCRKLSAGAILADNVRTCIRILREVNPGGRIAVWGDMFDPNHNARKDYYLVRGDLEGSWEGLDRDVLVLPWAYELRDKSIAFFAGRGHQVLLAGYYDDRPERIADWLASAGRHGGAAGVMYTTWRKQYDDLERFLALSGAAPR